MKGRHIIGSIILTAIILVAIGAISVNVHADFNGYVLHVWSNNYDSEYFEQKNETIWSSPGSRIIIQWDAYVDAANPTEYEDAWPCHAWIMLIWGNISAHNFSRVLPIAGFYAGNDSYVHIWFTYIPQFQVVRAKDIKTNYRWDAEHNYKIVLGVGAYGQGFYMFYIDNQLLHVGYPDGSGGGLLYFVKSIWAGGSDTVFSIYIDNVVVKVREPNGNENVVLQDDFNDGYDNVFTDDFLRGDAGEEILEAERVSEYPVFMVPVVSAVTLLVAVMIYSRKEPNTR